MPKQQRGIMHSVLFDDVEALLPHSGDMVLISGVTSWEENNITVFVNQDGSSIFADKEGSVAAWIGVEYMAQAIGVFAGIEAKLNDEPIRLGLLLGTRKYSCRVGSFPINSHLTIKAERIFFERYGVALFACSIHSDEQLLAEAEIKAIQPKSVTELINPNIA